jgi:uncharacterized membrane protein YdjX (TVP38/TMEM64 family)
VTRLIAVARKRLAAPRFDDRSAESGTPDNLRHHDRTIRVRLSTATRIALLVLVALGMIVAFALRGSFQPVALHDHIAEYPFAPLVFVTIMIVTGLVFVPRTILVVAGGLLFGMWWGLLWSTLGSTLGSVLGFVLARYVNAGLVDEATLPRLAPVLKAAERGGWRIVAFLRLVPILPNTPVNYALALTRVSLPAYTFGTLVGQLPTTFVWCEVGASGNTALSGGNWVMPTFLALALLAVSLVLPRLAFLRRWAGLRAD